MNIMKLLVKGQTYKNNQSVDDNQSKHENVHLPRRHDCSDFTLKSMKMNGLIFVFVKSHLLGLVHGKRCSRFVKIFSTHFLLMAQLAMLGIWILNKWRNLRFLTRSTVVSVREYSNTKLIPKIQKRTRKQYINQKFPQLLPMILKKKIFKIC